MITVTFHCGGCSATAQGTKPLDRKFLSLNGRGYGFGRHQYDTALDAIPEGWLYPCIVGCAYCPDCRKGLEEGE